MVLVVLAAVNWYLLKPLGPDINYFFLENFRVKYTLILDAFYEGEKKKNGLIYWVQAHLVTYTEIYKRH